MQWIISFFNISLNFSITNIQNKTGRFQFSMNTKCMKIIRDWSWKTINSMYFRAYAVSFLLSREENGWIYIFCDQVLPSHVNSEDIFFMAENYLKNVKFEFQIYHFPIFRIHTFIVLHFIENKHFSYSYMYYIVFHWKQTFKGGLFYAFF